MTLSRRMPELGPYGSVRGAVSNDRLPRLVLIAAGDSASLSQKPLLPRTPDFVRSGIATRKPAPSEPIIRPAGV
jgi:hypothetical protein